MINPADPFSQPPVAALPASGRQSDAAPAVYDPVVTFAQSSWTDGPLAAAAIAALEAGQVLFFPKLPFILAPSEYQLLTPDVRDPKVRNISLGSDHKLKGALGEPATLVALESMIARFRQQATTLVDQLLPHYQPVRRLAPTSYRPAKVETRAQSWRADDRRLHVDAFPSRPNYGERILRVFSNINPEGVPRIWRIGEPFEAVARHFLPGSKAYSAWQAKLLQAARVTKSFRSEYDHLMLQLHDGMKADLDYQQDARQVTIAFLSGSTWICFSDQASHAVMSGQYMLEQTLHLKPQDQYDPQASPLAILSRLTGRALT